MIYILHKHDMIAPEIPTAMYKFGSISAAVGSATKFSITIF